MFVKIGAGDHGSQGSGGRARAQPAESGGLRQPLPVPGHWRGVDQGAVQYALVTDSHCHIAGEEFVADLDAVVERARAAGVSRALVILAAEDDAEIARTSTPCSRRGPSAGSRSACIRITPRCSQSNPQARRGQGRRASRRAARSARDRRDRPRLSLRLLAARGAARGVSRANPPGARAAICRS